MLVDFHKYHALQNDFLVIEQTPPRIRKADLSRLCRSICHRRTGVGADGVLILSPSRRADRRLDVYNADGSWAEQSGNGLRIAGVHRYLQNRRKKSFAIESAGDLHVVTISRSSGGLHVAKTNLGQPQFEAARVPVRTRRKYMINATLRLGSTKVSAICLSIGNPHAVVFVDNFDFDWKALGAMIETHRAFPNRTNVEFVRVLGRRRIQVREWERGVGATGSSGTGAAAAVCAAVIFGLADRHCRVEFEPGSLTVHWREDNNSIELIGPVEFVGRGTCAIS
ncbi:MAG TPA: diaminopimelate epimerase [Candidatus Deferrimicrobium sp.]|nr:diaminopimelate epimerase [Candidatus Deferrimicrobium sp.]